MTRNQPANLFHISFSSTGGEIRMFKKIYILMAVLIIASMALAACQPAATPTEPAAPMEPALKVCQVTDTGGIDDKSFNATAWKGSKRAG
jgi:basic membrane protein A and related proteins